MATRRRRGIPIRDEQIEGVLEVLGESDLEELESFVDDDVADEDFNIIQNQESSSSSEESENDEPVAQRGRGRGRRPTRSRRQRQNSRSSRGSRSQVRERSVLRSANESNGSENVGDLEASEWDDCDFEPETVPFIQPAYLPIQRDHFTKIEYFYQYIDDKVIENIVEKSNWSYFSRNMKALHFTSEECKTYIAIQMIMSCINYPTLRMYWSKEFRIPIIANSMPRNRYFILRNAVKVVLDEEVSTVQRQADKLWKVRPLIDAVLKGCQLQEKTKDLSIDEMMIPFQGACGLKQYCPGKPNPVGLKAFVLATPDGLVCNYHIYQGNTTYPDLEGSSYGLGEKAVLTLTKDLVPGHIIYCDRYFTSEKLLDGLKDQGLMCTGTLMKNRIPRSARHVLPDDKVMKKRTRGSWEKVVHKAKKMVITKWLDNKPVSFMSNIHTDKNIDSCERWSKREKRYITVPRPEVVKLYNKNMGGVDLADRMLSVCPYRYRTRKWTQRIIAHFLDLAVTNSWILYRQDELNKGKRLKSIQQLRPFKLEIAKTLIKIAAEEQREESQEEKSQEEQSQEEQSQEEQSQEEESQVEESQEEEQDEEQLQQRSKFRQRCLPVPIPEDKIRYEGAMHMPEVGEDQKLCRRDECKKKSKIRCMSCKLNLCLTRDRNCFQKFHSRPIWEE
ncbi:hypothetical protein O0L34_g14666 [Tuta absoluta]|nr:hypothetical protein O0L34_g14828 [Tuta absoluta]KAJ2941609.1 hypothetical protein O0L34_g14666 [Tuta absoluta]